MRQSIYVVYLMYIGPNLEFEHLERELANSSGWPPLGKNNDVKIGNFFITAFSL